jgi:endonuclease YncB( thermonuclease family)
LDCGLRARGVYVLTLQSGQPFGEEAKKALVDFIDDRNVRLTLLSRDQYYLRHRMIRIGTLD